MLYTTKYLLLIALAAILLGPLSLPAQQIVFDRGVRAGELIAFPDVTNENNYYYLLDKASVAEVNGKPQFSFLRYVRNSAAAGGTSTVSESSEAGGVVHALVNLSVPEDMRREAEDELTALNPAAKLVGPVMYKSGRVALVSSVAGEDGEMTRQVVGIGNAPLLDNQKAALSIHLTKEGADILWATFQTPTPDLSFAFEMEAKGFLSPKNVKIEADFEQIYAHRGIEMAARSPVLAAEIKSTLDELSNTGGITVTQIGEDADLNKLKETAYTQLVNIMFDKVGGQGVPELGQLAAMGERKSMLDRAGEMLEKARTEARAANKELADQARAQQDYERRIRREARTAMDSFYRHHNIAYTFPPVSEADTTFEDPREVPIPGFAVAASFQLKEVRRTGKYTIDLNKYTEDARTFPFAENIGNIKNSCADCFHSVNLDADMYKQREVHAKLVGINAPDFESFINNVEVVLRKTHQNGSESVQSILVDRTKFNDAGNDFSWVYGWKDDTDRDAWLEFDYKTKWTFNNGATVETDWISQDFAAVNLVPPLVRRDVYVELDPEFASQENIRGAEVSITNRSLPGAPQNFRVNLKTAGDLLSRSVELIMEPDAQDYEYEVVYFPRGQQPVRVAPAQTNFGSIYLDVLPL